MSDLLLRAVLERLGVPLWSSLLQRLYEAARRGNPESCVSVRPMHLPTAGIRPETDRCVKTAAGGFFGQPALTWCGKSDSKKEECAGCAG
mmetsp:Transcript_46743/g.100028  ORF Transcript_46743/g.100028 Transcript_46743/m.100028 type:complete len:90 (-) Transcript_46743:1474-1743(-)